MNGPDLLILRIRAGLRAKDVGDVAGLTPSQVSRIENSARQVEADKASRYVAAVATLQAKGSSATSGVEAAS